MNTDMNTGDQIAFLNTISGFSFNPYFGRLDQVTNLFSRSISLRKNIPTLLRMRKSHLRELSNNIAKSDLPEIALNTDLFETKNKKLTKIIHYISKDMGNMLLGAFVHGSYATKEAIPYSDFDGVLIVKDYVFESSDSTREFINKVHSSNHLLLCIDPLQHHGWTVLTESDLNFFPDYYLPEIVLRNSKCLFTSNSTQFFLKYPSYGKLYEKPFMNTKKRLTSLLRRTERIRSLYSFKGLLSEFMLLPTLYLQARDHKPVLKGTSFQIARDYFKPDLWSVMDEVSSLRKDWPVVKHRFHVNWNNPLSKYILKNYFPEVPSLFSPYNRQIFFDRMIDLISAMSENVCKT